MTAAPWYPTVGDTVRSLDPRDKGTDVWIVAETHVTTSGGMAARIYEPHNPSWHVYRLYRNLTPGVMTGEEKQT